MSKKTRMTFEVVAIDFDTDDDTTLNATLQKQYIGTKWSVEDEKYEEEAKERVLDAISDQSGWCIFSLELKRI